MKASAFWTLFAVTMILYGTILFWSLPQISAAAGGLTPFDLRPTGYSFDEARAFIGALSPAGASFYLTTQHALDFIYPPLMSLTLFFAILALTPKRLGDWSWVLAVPALFIAVCDLMENLCVDWMLRAGAAALTPDLAAEASMWTALKSQSSTVVMSVLLILLIAWAWRAVTPQCRMPPHQSV